MEKNSIKLSICVPTYNRANTLRILLESIFCQIGEHSNEVEVCISDNASTDNTEEVVKSYYDKLNMKYKKQEKSVHPVVNWDYAIDKMAMGEYVLMIGDDDIFINDAIERMLKLINEEHADYYYLNHIHAQIDVNKDKVYNHNCIMEWDVSEGECYDATSKWVDKWEEILNYPGKYEDINMLYIGNHLMRKGIWQIDLEHFHELWCKNAGRPLCEDNLEYWYMVWSPQVMVVANAMMGKRCYYCGEPMICQGMGVNVAESPFPISGQLLFIPRWLELFRKLNMDEKEYDIYLKKVTHKEVDQYINLLLYRKELVKKYPFCSNFIYLQENTNDILFEIAEKLMDKNNDFYYNMANNYFCREINELLKNRTGTIVLWGTGDVAENYLNALPQLKEQIDFVVDGNIKLQGEIYEELGVMIHNPEEIKNRKVYVVIVASRRYEKEIKNTLQDYGMKDYWCIDSSGINYVEEL